MTRDEWLNKGRAIVRAGKAGQRNNQPMLLHPVFWIRWEYRAARWRRIGLENGWTHE